MKRILIPLLLSLTLSLHAQNATDNLPLPVWKAPIPESQGAYTVNLNSICSIALEIYNLEYEDETYPVTECVIHTLSGKTARFYFIDDRRAEKKDEEEKSPILKPIKKTVEVFLPPEDEEKQKEDKLRVVKVYPQSATSNSSEYRLDSEETVKNLYENLRKKWMSFAP